MFDLNAVTSGVTGANDTKFPIVPPAEYTAQVDKIEGKQVETAKGTATVIDMTWEVLDEDLKKELGLSKVTVRQSLWLDLTDQGKLDTGPAKNVRLGRLRDAFGLNDPSREFSFDQMLGQIALITVTNNPDKNDPETIYANVTKVGTIS